MPVNFLHPQQTAIPAMEATYPAKGEQGLVLGGAEHHVREGDGGLSYSQARRIPRWGRQQRGRAELEVGGSHQLLPSTEIQFLKRVLSLLTRYYLHRFVKIVASGATLENIRSRMKLIEC
jgi:hypothetical protein